LANDNIVPIASGVPLASIEEYRLSEITNYLPDIEPCTTDEGDTTSDALFTCASDSNKSATNAYDRYTESSSRPDRWDFAGPQFPWIEYPGCCDDWRVGPLLGVRVDGLFLERTNVSSDFLTSSLGTIPPYVLQNINRFEHAGGARAYFTSQNHDNFNMQLGLIGASDWNASAESQFTDAGNPLLDETRLNSYESNLQTIELNILPLSNLNTKWLIGARYVNFEEDFTLLTDRVNFDINNNNLATGFNDDWTANKIDNRLIGPQIGLRRDVWSQSRRFSFEGLINGGPYCNIISRKDIDQTFVTVNPPNDTATVEDESHQTQVRVDETIRRRQAAELAFFGEAALTGIYRFHPCVSVRAGYQAIWLQGAHLASDQFGQTSSVFFHGLHFGVEYRR
jgi:hypothetical protein